MNKQNIRLRKNSGEISSTSSLVSFLYILMRDYLPCGEVEEIIRRHCKKQESKYCNGFLAKYAMDIANRLK